ncbi:MAG: hypothetical protein U5K56_13685 [Halioglobus sp.]|nr:hypothetical protein [Halioglobus sp.]
MERAHDDGLQVSVESPEALEEIVWMPFWKKHYAPEKIQPWKSCDTEAFKAFFASHMRKIVALRSQAHGSPLRYASKNNMNIARLRAIPAMLPDSTIIVPFRQPLQQAASLLNQHERFLEMHREDSFSRRYMAGTGHFDFGANLRPIDFDGWLQARRCDDPLQLAFWLEYWIAAYRHVLDHTGDAGPATVFRDVDGAARGYVAAVVGDSRAVGRAVAGAPGQHPSALPCTRHRYQRPPTGARRYCRGAARAASGTRPGSRRAGRRAIVPRCPGS